MAKGTGREPIDGNEAAARVAYSASECIAIYPITPASTMGELADAWASQKRKNLWGAVPSVVEMQSEAGAAGALHGALSVGSLATTFTASQGLLLMIPDMYKIAGELTPFVMHVAARSVATHALSIFGDHSDVMAARQTGFAMLCSGSVQEAADFAAIAHAATLQCRVPFLHFFDGFRTSHEIQDVEPVGEDALRAMISDDAVRAHRARALSPEHPTIRGTSQNPDVFFQSREAANRYYQACPAAVRLAMHRFAKLTGRSYSLFDYYGDPAAERVVIVMGSARGALEEAADALNARGGKVGVVTVRLFRPFSAEDLLAAIPPTARAIAVLDRTKEPGSLGEPLLLDAGLALLESGRGATTKLIGGRYGLSSKEFTPGMAQAVFAELAKPRPRRRFTVGIKDDIGGLSLDYRDDGGEPEGVTRAVFFGLGSDGTVGANKNTVKIIAERAGLYAQAYFVYDSKKSGSLTVSHLRFGRRPIRSSYLIRSADLVACHQSSLLDRFDVLELAAPGAIFLLNTASPERAWDALPREAQEAIIEKRIRFFAIDAYGIAKAAGLGPRINTVMQVAFFEVAGVLPDYLEAVKEGIRKSYGAKRPELVERNIRAVEAAKAGLRRIELPEKATSTKRMRPGLNGDAPPFVREVLGEILAGRGDALPVSSLPADGTFPAATARFEKRSIADEVPVWEESLCIQCNKCALVCPHAAIRVKAWIGEPTQFKSVPWRGRELAQGTRYSVQLSPEDCTGCRLCFEICPAHAKDEPTKKALAMVPLTGELRERESANFKLFLGAPEADAAAIPAETAKGSQLRQPLFEFSGACAGCGETPYLKLLTQLCGDRLFIANATGCSSIYGGNLPTTPWTVNAQGRGPAWSNSLFEDNAEFGLGFRLALDQQRAYALQLLKELAPELGDETVSALLSPEAFDARALRERRERVAALRERLAELDDPRASDLLAVSGTLERSSVWIVGGDGWAYDIGFGGLDHVLRSGANVKVLVLDTQVYSNTGGQASKATPRGAIARFAADGKCSAAKDLALSAVDMGGVYVASIAMGASDTQTVKALADAERHDGPALVVAYAHCIAHGFDICEGLTQQKRAVDSGFWPLFRYDPAGAGLTLDSAPGRIPLEDFLYREARFRALKDGSPEEAEKLLSLAKLDVDRKWKKLAALQKV